MKPAERDSCEGCEAPLPVGFDSGLCPRCLLAGGLESGDSDDRTTTGPAGEKTVSSDPARHSASPAESSGPLEQLGATIGRYRLIERIGEGGFGVVYLAGQTEPVKRRVALKVIKPGMDTREVVARFEAERQALALMDHPHIARVYDGGATENGRPYFVMELVEGRPLTRYCDDQLLTTRQRLDLFLDVLAAVQHAHQKGIIHRDLKPSNILVCPHDDRPVVKVIDFGIAKALSMELTERTFFTGYGQMIGTPQYMSPEQAEVNAVDVDTRSDIYSLGVVLYELLTGATPIDPAKLRAAAYGEIQRLIREEEPPKPSTRISTLGEALPDVARRHGAERVKLAKLVRGDLDWIVMKALEKDRTRRYETAGAFAADLRRHQAHEPVEAGAPSVTYRVRKLIRRHRGPMAASLAVLLTLLVGIGFSTWQAKAAKAAERETAGARDDARREARISKMVNEFINKVLLGSASPDYEPNRDLTVREVLDRTAEAVESEMSEQPLVEAGIRDSLYSSYAALGEFDEALKHAERAWKLRAAELGEDHRETLLARLCLASVLLSQGRHVESEALCRELVGVLERRFGSDDLGVVSARGNLAVALEAQHKYAESEREHRVVIAMLEKSADPNPHPRLTSHMNLGNVLWAQGRNAEAEREYLAILEPMKSELGELAPTTLRCRHNLALVTAALGRLAEAEAEMREIISLRTEVLGGEHPETLTTRNNLVAALMGQHKFAEALREAREVIELRKKVLGTDAPDSLESQGVLGDLLVAAGQYESAARELPAMLEQQSRLLGPESRRTLNTRHNLAASRQFLGHDVVEEFRAILALKVRVLGSEDADTLRTRMGLASGLGGKGDHAGAEAEFRALIPLLMKVNGANHEDTLMAGMNLAMSLLAQYKPEEAALLTEMYLERARHALGENHAVTRKLDEMCRYLKR